MDNDIATSAEAHEADALPRQARQAEKPGGMGL